MFSNTLFVFRLLQYYNFDTINKKNYLHYACLHEDSDEDDEYVDDEESIIAKMLIDKGADVNKQDENGETPLHLANRKSTRLLLKNRADPEIRNYKGDTPLFNHIERYWYKSIKLLLDNGANVNVQNNDGYTPLMISVSYFDSVSADDITSLLLSYDANPNIINSIHEVTALTEAVEFNNASGVLLLVSYGADLSINKKNGKDTLLKMFTNFSLENLEEILEVALMDDDVKIKNKIIILDVINTLTDNDRKNKIMKILNDIEVKHNG